MIHTPELPLQTRIGGECPCVTRVTNDGNLWNFYAETGCETVRATSATTTLPMWRDWRWPVLSKLPIRRLDHHAATATERRPWLHALAGPTVGHPSRHLDLIPYASSHSLPSAGCWEDTLQKVPDFIGADEQKSRSIRFTPESGHSEARRKCPLKSGGPGCLNRFSASISGASAGVRLPSGEAAA